MVNCQVVLTFTDVICCAIVNAPTREEAAKICEAYYRAKQLTRPVKLNHVAYTETIMPESPYITAFKAEQAKSATIFEVVYCERAGSYEDAQWTRLAPGVIADSRSVSAPANLDSLAYVVAGYMRYDQREDEAVRVEDADICGDVLETEDYAYKWQAVTSEEVIPERS